MNVLSFLAAAAPCSIAISAVTNTREVLFQTSNPGPKTLNQSALPKSRHPAILR
jgi:hypothetical protein